MSAPFPLLQSPLPGYIEPKGASVDNGRQVVTATLADHQARGSAGTDIAPYPRNPGQPVRLMRAGVMYQSYKQPAHNPPQIGDGALIRRFRHAEGNTGYAHLSAFASGLVLGRSYPAGTLIGWQGNSGTVRVHLHTHWQGNDGIHREMYVRLEQSRNLQYNAGVSGVRIRATPGLAGAIVGVAGPGGIVRSSDGKVVAPLSAVLARRHVVHVAKDGYVWMPIAVGGITGWTARPFIHFV